MLSSNITSWLPNFLGARKLKYRVLLTWSAKGAAVLHCNYITEGGGDYQGFFGISIKQRSVKEKRAWGSVKGRKEGLAATWDIFLLIVQS
jgi:hypothetical protein